MAWTIRGNDVGARVARSALAVGILLGAAGCAGAPVYKENKEAYVFTIAFDGACPVAATVDFRNCPDKREDCVRVRGGDAVRFEASPAKDAAGKANDFVLRFDPFGQTGIESANGVRTLTAEGHERHGKPFTFTIAAKGPGCPRPVDPQIILD